MQDTFLLKIVTTLDDTDKKAVRQGLESPTFNRRSEMLRLWDFIEKAIKKQRRKSKHSMRSSNDFTKQAAFAHVFGKKIPFDDGKMRHYMSYLLELIREVLAWENIKTDSNKVRLHSFSAFKKTGDPVILEKEIKRLRAGIEQTKKRSSSYFFERFHLEKETWELFGKRQINTEATVQNLRYSFSAYVAINALQQACIARSQKAWAGSEADFPYLLETIRLYEAGHFTDEIAVHAWMSGYWALTKSEENVHFQSLKSILEQSAAVFPLSELRDLHILALNVCIRRVNAAERSYLREAFDLYKSGLLTGVFLENGRLAKATYRNVLNAAASLGEWAWALAYLQEFAPYLAPKERENIYHYNLATYHFRKGEFDAALDLLRHVEMSTHLENFDVRRMLLRIYYAQSAWDALASLLDSFSIYLQRHKDGSYHHKMYTNLVRFSKKMTTLREGASEERKKLQKAIRAAEFVAEREWLLEVL